MVSSRLLSLPFTQHYFDFSFPLLPLQRWNQYTKNLECNQNSCTANEASEFVRMASETASVDSETVGPAYTSPDITSCPPLVQLFTYGICCPFFETEEDHDARVGVQLLTNYPITWYRKQQIDNVSDDEEDNKPNDPSQEGGFIDGLVSSVDKLFGRVLPAKSSVYDGVPATLSIIDTEQCGPLIKVKATDVGQQEAATSGTQSKDEEWWDDHSDKQTLVSIPLYLVDSVSAGWSLIGDETEGGIKLFARNEQSSKGLLGRGSGEELLRFDTLGGGGDDWSEVMFPLKSTEPNKHADRIITRLRALIAWNRKRMAADVEQGKIIIPSNIVEVE